MGGFLCSTLQAGNIIISESSSNGSFPLVVNNVSAPVLIDNGDADVVKIVAQAFSNDVKLLTGVKPTIKTSVENTPMVIVGTLGKSALIDQLATNGKINKSRLEGKWETFCISVVDNPVSGVSQGLVIAGSDPRGTAFGVFELSRKMGVSPWIWWADVTPETRSTIYVSGDNVFGPPSVKYRGMFLNDEDFGLKPWAAKNMDSGIRGGGKGDIGPNAYKKIFEMMLRTKSNYIWPAMHACTWAFWYYESNRKAAQEYSIVLGSSHCEPMLRNNEDEWKRSFSSEYPGVTKGDWNWKTNSSVIKTYWTDRVKQSKGIDAVFTMGMRGVHDEVMEGYSNDTERAAAVNNIISTQRNILETNLGKPQASISQLFCPYKEVLLQYNAGIKLPDDITLLWPDDNHGFIRQLSTPEEQKRGGGSGVYYHFSYWGPPQQSYLWLTSTSPVKTSYEMSKAYDMNAKDIWVFNVGDLKHAEFEYQFAMDLAWDIDAWRPEKAHQYMKFWAEETFGTTLANDIAEIQKLHYYLSASGRPEHTDWSTFSVLEMEQRIADYAALVQKVKTLEPSIPTRLKDAYFELITYPVICTAAMNEKILGAKLSFEYARIGEKTKALTISTQAREAYRVIQDLSTYYNKTIAGGKWNEMVSYSPRSIGFFYDPDVVNNKTLQNEPIPAEIIPVPTKVSAKSYQNKSDKVKIIEQLGVMGDALAVLPLDMTSYTVSNISSAPSAEYKVQLIKGNNRIRVLCLPTFPLYPGMSLRFAISVDGANPTFVNIAQLENNEEWRTNILRGYARGDVFVNSNTNKEATVKIYFADPGLVINGVETLGLAKHENDVTNLLINPDFELDKNGNQLESGTLNRGTPPGWKQTGTLKGNSWGTNQDVINMHGEHACWYASDPMPAYFELSQTIKNITPGEYVVRCRLAVPASLMTTQRLFANTKVMYYGKESDYSSNLTNGEENQFAGYTPGYESKTGTMMELREMALKIIVLPGEELTLGIRTSNKLGDGTSDNSGRSGWFKVDYFRLERIQEISKENIKTMLSDLITEAQGLYNSTSAGTNVGQYPQASRFLFDTAIQSAQSVNQNANATMEQILEAFNSLKNAINVYKESVIGYTAYIQNPSFENYLDGTPIDVTSTTDSQLSSGALRTTPPGWLQTGNIVGTSFGINRDANNKDGDNVCWYKSSPMPADFSLYQNIAGLPAGKYTVRCRMAVPSGKLTTQRLFANNNVQYYGYASDYVSNIAANEEYSFASLNTLSATPYELAEMEVDVVVSNGETLKLGVYSSNKKSNGTNSTSDDGWFKIDHFRLELKELHGGSKLLELVEGKFFTVRGEKGSCVINFEKDFKHAHVRIYSLSGNLMYNSKVHNQETRVSLPYGLYLASISLNGQENTAKILVK